MDPIADKLLVITSFIMLGPIGGIPMWLAIVVVSRDLLILLGYGIIYFLIDERLQVKPSTIGKWSTMLQLLTLGVALALLHDAKILDRRLWNVFIASRRFYGCFRSAVPLPWLGLAAKSGPHRSPSWLTRGLEIDNKINFLR